MALDERYITNTSLNQYLVNKDTGLPLSNGTLTFYRDLSRNTLKPIYQLTGSPPNYSYTALPNPLTLSSVGTIQNAGGDNEMLYYYPYDDEGNLDLYYIVAKDSGGNTQFTREAFPNIAATADPSDDIASVTNQLANPQFSRVFTNEGLTTSYAVSGSALTFEFAPDWVFEIEGTGTVTVSRTAVSGTLGIPTSPSYYITVTVPAGVTSCKLRQRLYYNSGLWATTADQDMSLACVLVGRNELAGNAALSIFYKESTSTDAPTEILAGTVAPGAWTVLKDSNQIPTSTNSDTGSSAYVDIYVAFPLNSSTSITSIQVVPVASDDVVNLLDYDQESSNREQALMGDYFIPNLEAKQIQSLLTGWDFPLNPAQLGSSGTMPNAAAAGYILDQTIGVDVPGSATYTKSSVTGGLQVTSVGTDNAFYLLQYLTGKEAKKILGNKLAVNVNAYKGSVGDAVTMRVYLYRAPESKAEVFAATAAALPASTYANGTAGVGATLTENANGALSVDGLAPAVGQRVLIKDQVSTLQNGVYTVTDAGSAGSPYVLTRATDFDSAADIYQGCIVPVAPGGTANGNLVFGETALVTTIGTDAITFGATNSVPTLPLTIGSLATTGVFTKNDTVLQGMNWTLIERGGIGTATVTLNTVSTNDEINEDANDYGFSQWQITDATQIADTGKFAIVVSFAYQTAATVITINSISVVPGEMPCRPGIKSFESTILDCEYYYRKSFKVETIPRTAGGENTGEEVTAQGVGGGLIYLFGNVRFMQEMRSAPTVITYNPEVANAQARCYSTLPRSDCGSTTVRGAYNTGFYISFITSGASAAGMTNAVHWSADSRLGVVH